jgi:hypothetical protein
MKPPQKNGLKKYHENKFDVLLVPIFLLLK